MGVDESILGLINAADAAHLPPGQQTEDTTQWIPALGEAVTMQRGLHLDLSAGRLLDGLELKRESTRAFVSEPYAVAAFEAVDGRRSVSEIMSAVLAAAPWSVRLATHLRLANLFVEARRAGLLRACSVA